MEKYYEIIEPDDEVYGLLSVKRLSDGAVYMIGDQTKDGTIIDFEEEDTALYCIVVGRRGDGDIFRCDLDDMLDVNLFTTDDEVDIINADQRVHYVTMDIRDGVVYLKQSEAEASYVKKLLDNCQCIAVVADKENLRYVV